MRKIFFLSFPLFRGGGVRTKSVKVHTFFFRMRPFLRLVGGWLVLDYMQRQPLIQIFESKTQDFRFGQKLDNNIIKDKNCSFFNLCSCTRCPPQKKWDLLLLLQVVNPTFFWYTLQCFQISFMMVWYKNLTKF